MSVSVHSSVDLTFGSQLNSDCEEQIESRKASLALKTGVFEEIKEVDEEYNAQSSKNLNSGETFRHQRMAELTPENSGRLLPHNSWHSIQNGSSAVKVNCQNEIESAGQTTAFVALRQSPVHKENAISTCFKKQNQFKPKLIGKRQSDSNDQRRLNSVGSSHDYKLRLKKPPATETNNNSRFARLATSASLSQKKSKSNLSKTFTPVRAIEQKGNENRLFRESFLASENREQTSSSTLDPNLKDFGKLNWFLRRSNKRIE